ncbi:MAG: tetratricopeptide repeat protein [Bacilli bacterium]|nr:tetratricopeptide repeat protein [Bacilli bacterium]MDD4077211.1 tetratricopeptide repeat protein [Bacilli bacterium]MDD4387667.1 tetratricopeptide repeat protein [Bacilli bacterium]
MDKYNELIAQAKQAYRQQKMDEAARLYEEAFKEMVIVEDLIDLALIYLDNKMPVKALSAFQAIIDVFPGSPQGYYGLGLAYEQLGKRDLAEEAYLNTIKNDHTFAQAYFNIALLADDDGNEQKAYDYYKKTLIYNSEHFWANLNLGSFYEKNNYLDLALQHTLKAYKINRQEKMVTFNLGVIYGKLGDYESALKYYKEEAKKSNCYLMTHLNIALIYKDVYSDYKISRRYLLEGIARFKDNTALWYNLGCLYALLKDYENAHNCLYYAVIKKPDLQQMINEDEELVDFRKTNYYFNLLKKIKGD